MRQPFRIFYTLLLLLITTSFLRAQDCKLQGYIKNKQNNEGIPFASVSIVGSQQQTICDAKGFYSFNKLPAGYILLQATSIGYDSRQSESLLLQRQQITTADLYLPPKTNILQAVEVRPNNFIKREEAPISMQSIGIKEIEHNAGSNRDISRVIQAFPGVGSTTAFRNDLIIRGGGPAENRFFLDEVEIPVLNHFSTQGASGGPVGIINADFIQSVEFYASAFPACKYNALSGILDFKQSDGNTKKLHTQLALGASEASITLDGPIGKNTTYIFSVRRSYLQFLFSAIGLPFLPTFNDYQLKTKTQIDKHRQLTIISIGALDHMRINKNINQPTPSQQAIAASIPINEQWTYTIGAVYKHFVKQGYHSFVISRNKLHNNLYKYPENNEQQAKQFDYSSSETENKVRYEYHMRKGSTKYIISAGMEQASYHNNTKQQLLISDSVINLQYQNSLHLLKYGLSAQAVKKFFKDKLLCSLGIRFDGNSYNPKMRNLLHQSSPRLSLAYQLNPHCKINASAGKYYQQAAYTTLGYKNRVGEMVNKANADFIGLYQYNIGLERSWSDKMILSLEGFYKQYFHYPIDIISGSSLANQGNNYFVYGNTEVDFTGEGRSYGAELLYRINLPRFTLLASYTYFYSQFTNLENQYIASAWDSRHLFSLTASKQLNKHWQIGAKWRYVGGLPHTPYDLEKSALISIWSVNNGPTYNNSQLNSLRYPAFHQLDLRIDKQFFFPKWTLMLYFDVQNAYNFKSKGKDIIIRKKNEDGSYQLSTDGQSYILESYKNLQGTLLPTVGIMVKL